MQPFLVLYCSVNIWYVFLFVIMIPWNSFHHRDFWEIKNIAYRYCSPHVLCLSSLQLNKVMKYSRQLFR